MTDPASKPTLAAMPPEILGFIIPDPQHLEETPITNWHMLAAQALYRSMDPDSTTRESRVKIADNYPHPKWLAIRSWDEDEHDVVLKETVYTLRSLSQTCQSLRAYALPILWSMTHISSVNELGRLRETLRVSPYIASFIRSFAFFWNPFDPNIGWIPYLGGDHTLLELAFRDRSQVWGSLASRFGARMERKVYEYENGWRRCFVHNGEEYFEPGRPPVIKEEDTEVESGYDWEAPTEDASGPDGKGEDRLIKSVEDFNSCIAEIVMQLTSLETFAWRTSIATIPVPAFEALTQLTNLTSLHVDIKSLCSGAHALPFWKLVSNLKDLSLSLEHPYYDNPDGDGEEPDEAIFASFELPSSLPTTLQGIDEMHYAIVHRTIVAAARQGKLQRLSCTGEEMQGSFALRSLVPYWVGVERWFVDGLNGPTSWQGNAASLCRTLAHVSRWLDTSSSPLTLRDDRLLTLQELQSLHTEAHLEISESMTQTQACQVLARRDINLYLPWFQQDAELAQRVVDAWNAIVGRGEAGVVECICPLCEHSHELAS